MWIVGLNLSIKINFWGFKMGRDIHVFLEYKHKFRKGWSSFSSGAIHLERNYFMFHIFYGKGKPFFGEDKSFFCFEPKGKIPIEDLSTCARSKRIELVGRSKRAQKNAFKWNEKFGCRLFYCSDGEIWSADCPDYHTDTWLAFVEYEKALGIYRQEIGDEPSADYMALYEAMEVFEQAGNETRLVIWFDN